MTPTDMKRIELPTDAVPRHLHSLDAMRGLAALSVVLYHWDFLYLHGTETPTIDPARLPLFWLLKYLYLDGWHAVEFFFCLSGFIFYWLYCENVASRKTSAWEFAVLRFSRLYPLHVVTLVGVAIGQQLMRWRFGSYFECSDNDPHHFVLQLLMISHWSEYGKYSFNSPIWSVSVEVFLYGVFFVACRVNFRRLWQIALFIPLGYVMGTVAHLDLGRGMVSFFIGGLCYHLFVNLHRRHPSAAALRLLGMFTIVLWLLIPLNTEHAYIYRWYQDHHLSVGLIVHGRDLIAFLLLQLTARSFELILFPLTIVTLALWEANGGVLNNWMSFLGEISYSSYLLHFPLQIALVAFIRVAGIPNTVFDSPLALILFFGILIPLSMCSYRFFEKPCQKWIRKRALGTATKSPATAQESSALIPAKALPQSGKN